jgi:hypothetical protein
MLRTISVAACCAAVFVCPARAVDGVHASEDAPVPGAVVCSVIDARDNGVPDAALRLRNVTTGRIDATGRSNDEGRFTFERVGRGSYIVEVVDREGAIVAIGRTFTVAPGETAATVVRLAGRTRWFAGFFGNAAAAAVASAAALGVTAVAPTGQAVSGVR